MAEEKWYHKLGNWIKRQVKKAVDFVKKIYAKAKDWWSKNRGEVVGALGEIAGACAAVNLLSSKFMGKVKRSAYGLSRNKIYDPRYGHYWPLRRRPTPEEYDMIHRRYRSGEEYYDILKDMGLLKGGFFW